MKKIGVIGGYGDVGINVLKVLNRSDKYSIFGVGRDIKKVRKEDREQLHNVKWMNLNIRDEDTMLNFIKDIDIIVNCTGPSYLYSSKIAKICLENKCKLVDVGFDDRIDEIMEGKDRTCIYACGSSPGLSGLLCRYLASKFKEIISLRYITSTSGVFSYSGAWDYLEGATKKRNISMACWKDGELQRNSLKRKKNQYLPFIEETVDMFPYFDDESKAVVDKIKPNYAEWYVVFGGKYLKSQLDKSNILFRHDKEAAVNELVKASKLDAMNKKDYVIYIVEIKGIDEDKNEKVKTLVLKCNKPAALTGKVAAIVSEMTIERDYIKGIFPLSKIDEYEEIIRRLKEIGNIEQFHIYDLDIESLMITQEGEI